MKEYFVEEIYDAENEETTYKIKIVMPLGISLRSLIIAKVKKGESFTEPELYSIIQQLLEGGIQLIKLKIAHRDIKLDNILHFGNDILTPKSVKISDYGLSYLPFMSLDSLNRVTSIREKPLGTYYFMSPNLKKLVDTN
jgi:serine/threonine protein kinase